MKDVGKVLDSKIQSALAPLPDAVLKSFGTGGAVAVL